MTCWSSDIFTSKFDSFFHLSDDFVIHRSFYLSASLLVTSSYVSGSSQFTTEIHEIHALRYLIGGFIDLRSLNRCSWFCLSFPIFFCSTVLCRSSSVWLLFSSVYCRESCTGRSLCSSSSGSTASSVGWSKLITACLIDFGFLLDNVYTAYR